MAFPTFRSVTTNGDSGTSIDHNLPATIESGDLLLAFLAVDGSRTITWDNTTAGTWTELATTGTAGGLHATHIYAKIADGTEDSATLVHVISSAEQTIARAVAVQDWEGTLGGVTISTVAEGASTTPDPSSVTAAGGSGDNLFIAWHGYNDATTTNTGYPTNYDDNQATSAHSTGQGVGNAIATRDLVSASDDPGTFTLDTSEQWDAYTIVVEPVAAAGGRIMSSIVNAGGLAAAGGIAGRGGGLAG